MPISDAQKMRCQTGVLLEPPEASVSTTMAPESADVTKDDNHRHGDKRKHAGEREMLQEVKQRQRHVLLHRSGEVCRTLFHNEVNGAVAEHRHPHEGEAGRDEQHAQTNSRMVRPRETRAMNIPTKGDQESHHPQ